jgi:hypothetical protein
VSPDEIVAEIRRLYFAAAPGTIDRDLARAIALLKQLPTDEERMRAAGLMDGLAQLRTEWAARKPGGRRRR